MVPEPPEQETACCPVCGPHPAARLGTLRDINLFLPGEWPLWRCRGCGTGFLNPRPAPGAMPRFYPDDYWAPPPPPGTKPFVDRATRVAIRRLRRLAPGSSVLDVGCGSGQLAAHLRSLGFQAAGLDPSPRACALARQHYGIEVACGDLRAAPWPASTFDAVTLFDVLEHLHDPVADLARARSLLKPGGVLVVKSPNFDALQARLLGRWWYFLDAPRHLYHFTPRSLRAALRQAGFASADCRAIADPIGALVFETSIIYWLRGRAQPQTAAAASGSAPGACPPPVQTYPAVPRWTKRAFRTALRHLLYAPVSVENLLGRSVQLLAFARK